MANMKNGKLRALCAAALAAGGAAAVQRLLDRRPPAGSWTRTSYSGADVSLTEGAAAAGGVALGLAPPVPSTTTSKTGSRPGARDSPGTSARCAKAA